MEAGLTEEIVRLLVLPDNAAVIGKEKQLNGYDSMFCRK
jgi:hypothetical protein